MVLKQLGVNNSPTYIYCMENVNGVIEIFIVPIMNGMELLIVIDLN